MHKTARASVDLNACAKSDIDNDVSASAVTLVSKSTNRPSGEPCPANEITITSSLPAPDRRSSTACLTEACVAFQSVSSRPVIPGKVSVKSAQSAVASRHAPLSSGILGSTCWFTPMKTALGVTVLPVFFDRKPSRPMALRSRMTTFETTWNCNLRFNAGDVMPRAAHFFRPAPEPNRKPRARQPRIAPEAQSRNAAGVS